MKDEERKHLERSIELEEIDAQSKDTLEKYNHLD